jgi:hypothetical protein
MIKTFLCATVLLIGWQQAWGYALLGPRTDMGGLPATYGDTWETPEIAYDLAGDVGTPKNIGQGYRRNIPVMYYAYDDTFSGYFGVQGEQAIDGAFAIMNNVFTNNHSASLDGYSLNLSEFPDNSQTFNFTAESLGLTDLKSEALLLMAEQMGLSQPERYVWTLHDRFLPPNGKCPLDEEYLVVQRNYDDTVGPLSPQYSSYINDTLYSYEIAEFCNPPLPPDAVTVPFSPDPFAPTFTAVAGEGIGLGVTDVTSPSLIWASPEVGGFYTGLTRDDVAGMRYLMTSNNIVFEDPGLGTQFENTNFTTLNLLITSNLTDLLEFSSTNPPAAVAAQFPNVVIGSVSNFFIVVSNPIVVAYFTNFIGSPAGTPPTLVVKTNGFTLSFPQRFAYTFDNVVIVHEYTNTTALLQTVTPAEPIGAPVGSPAITNITTKKIILTNVISGDYFTLPPGSCGFDIVETLASNNVAASFTNVIALATNTVTGTNTTAAGFVGSESIITTFTNDIFEYFACNFTTSSPAFYQGIGHVQFIREPDTSLDPLTEAFIQPVTNTYTMVWFNPTNSQLGVRRFQRIVTQPDILFAAEDLATPAHGVAQIGVTLGTRNVNFDIANIQPGLAGPGVIDPPTLITFNEVGDIFGNGSLALNVLSTNGFLSELTQGSILAWGSFNASTNPPIVYPSGTSIQQLENQLVISITPTSLPDGTNDVTYPTTVFTATGGQPPYTWSLDGTQLPQGLAFFNGVLSGTPVSDPPGIYDFTIQLTDSDNRVVDLPYSITIH